MKTVYVQLCEREPITGKKHTKSFTIRNAGDIHEVAILIKTYFRDLETIRGGGTFTTQLWKNDN